MPLTFLTPTLTKYGLRLLYILCTWLTAHGMAATSGFFADHNSAIVGAVITGLAAVATDFRGTLNSERFKAAIKYVAGLLPNATHEETVSKVATAVKIATSPFPEESGQGGTVAARGIGLVAVLIAASFTLTGCDSLSLANAKRGVAADIQSPASKVLAADLFSSAVNILAAASAKGTDPQADVAAMNSLAGVFESYSALPTTSTQLQALASNAASLSPTIQAQTPQIVALVEKGVKGGLTPEAALQQVAGGVYAATGVTGQ